MACHYVMLIANPDSQDRLLLTVSNSVAHYERSWCTQKRSARVTTIRTAAWMEEVPTYKSSVGKRQLPYSDLLECSLVVIAHFAPEGKPLFLNETNTLCVGVGVCVYECVRMCAHACLSTKHFWTALAQINVWRLINNVEVLCAMLPNIRKITACMWISLRLVHLYFC